MFGSLKKKLKEGVKRLTEKMEHPQQQPQEDLPQEQPPEEPSDVSEPVEESHPEETPEEPLPEEPPKPEPPPKPPEPEIPPEPPKEEPKPEKKSFKERLGIKKVTTKIIERSLSLSDIENFFTESEPDLLEANVAVPVIDFLKHDLEEQLVKRQVKRGKAGNEITNAFKHALLGVLDQGSLNLFDKMKEKKPLTVLMLGFNGSGKTTTIAKLAHLLKREGKTSVLAAGDTFRAASIEQLEVHAKRIGVPLVKQQYGADAAAVIFDARKHAEANAIDVVLADTAGRTHIDKNLIDELKKIVRVNKPDLKVLVIDSLTGNDAVEQAKLYHDAVGVDAVVLTKVDVNTKGGAILSVAFAIKKPILYLGTGQGYDDLQVFDPDTFVNELLA
ncbi:MAG: signal recognition particle-docking protein FtsY [Nanoarchaeota archaeon]|nr:signal recognition particle-docking protein FtsY [Nanoarchaeota archaeon]